MQLLLIIIAAIHVLSGVFWAGSTFVAARVGGDMSERLFKPQMGAATLAVISGMVLWNLMHHGIVAASGKILAVGALSAIVAAGNQGVAVGRARRKLARGGEADAGALRTRMAIAQRASAGLLAITVICMAIARFI